MTTHEVIEVPDEDLRSLMEELAEHLERSFIVYTTIHMRLSKGSLKSAKLKVYRAVEPIFKSFVFVTPLTSNKDLPSMSATWNPEEIDDKDIGCLLSNVPNWNWNKSFHVFHCTWEFKIRFEGFLERKLITANNTSMTESYPMKSHIRMTLAKEDLNFPEMSPEYEIGPIPSSAVNSILSIWDYNFQDSEEGLSEKMDVYQGIAAFEKLKGSDVDKPLSTRIVAWSLHHINGAIGMTYTLPEHRKNGLGGVLTVNLAKRAFDEGRKAFVVIGEKNNQSIQFHKKLGFKTDTKTGMSLFLAEGETIKDYLKN